MTSPGPSPRWEGPGDEANNNNIMIIALSTPTQTSLATPLVPNPRRWEEQENLIVVTKYR